MPFAVTKKKITENDKKHQTVSLRQDEISSLAPNSGRWCINASLKQLALKNRPSTTEGCFTSNFQKNKIQFASHSWYDIDFFRVFWIRSMVCTLCLGFSSHYIFPFRKKKRMLWKNYQLWKNLPFPFDGPQISSSTRTIRVAWENTRIFFLGKINQAKKKQGPCNSGTPSHLYYSHTIPIFESLEVWE